MKAVKIFAEGSSTDNADVSNNVIGSIPRKLKFKFVSEKPILDAFLWAMTKIQ